MSRARIAVVLGVVLVSSTGCWEQVSPEWFAQMKEQPAVQALEGPSAPLAPPEGTIPAGGMAPRIPADDPLMAAGNPMHSPLARALPNPIEATPASIERGEKVYEVYCAVCHASDGMSSPAERPVAGKLAAFGAPPFPLSTTVAYTDGQIFTKIRYGKPLMPGYPQISEEDRWHCVNYLRTMFKRN